MIKVNQSFMEYLLSKKKFASLYANTISEYAFKSNRRQYFNLQENVPSNPAKNPKEENGVYIPTNYGRLVSEAYADYEVGGGIFFEFGEEKKSQDINNFFEEIGLNEKLHKAFSKKSALGYSVVLVSKNDGQVRVSNIPISNYYPDLSSVMVGDTIEDITTHRIISRVLEGDRYFSYVHEFVKTEKKRAFKYSKYEDYGQTNKVTGIVLKNEIEVIQEETLDYLPLFVLNNDISKDEDFDDLKKTRYTPFDDYANCSVLGESDYADIIDIIMEINDRTTQISIENYKHLGSKMSFPASTIDNMLKKQQQDIRTLVARGELSEQDAKAILNTSMIQPNYEFYTHVQGEQPAQYISKSNQYLDYSVVQTSEMIRRLSAITKVPVSFLGIEEKSGNMLVGTTYKQYERFFKKIQSKRNTIKRTIEKMASYIVFLDIGEYKTCSAVFESLYAQDFGSLAVGLSTAKASGLISSETATGMLLGIDKDPLAKELERIEKESQINIAIQPPFITNNTIE